MRVLLITHVQFWRRVFGAELRVSGVISGLVATGAEVSVLHTERLFRKERRAARSYGVSKLYEAADWEASCFGRLVSSRRRALSRMLRENMPARAIGFLKAIRGVYRKLTGYRTPGPTRLGDLHRQCLSSAVRAVCLDLKPDVVIVEYVAFAYVHGAIEGQPVTVVDTHDVMHLRQQAFDRQGIPHWLNLSREEEAEALRPFDIVVAIQEEEAKVFRDMLPDARVVTCPPWFEPVVGGTDVETAESEVPLILFVASRMEANWKGLEEFLEKAWPLVRQGAPDCRLRVCGSVCGRFSGRKFPGVDFAGFVDDLGVEYARTQVVVSPVTFGGGIKVKCLEAMAHGKPCVISRHSTAGFQEGEGTAFLVADDWREFAEKTLRLLRDAELRSTLSARALDFVKDNFSRERCLGPMLQAIDEARSRKQAGEVGTA